MTRNVFGWCVIASLASVWGTGCGAPESTDALLEEQLALAASGKPSCGLSTPDEADAARLVAENPEAFDAENPVPLSEVKSILAQQGEGEQASSATAVFPFVTVKYHGMISYPGYDTAYQCYIINSGDFTCQFPGTKYFVIDSASLPSNSAHTAKIRDAFKRALTGTNFTISAFGTPNVKLVSTNGNYQALAKCTQYASTTRTLANYNNRKARLCMKWTIEFNYNGFLGTTQTYFDRLVKHEMGHVMGWGHFAYGVMNPYSSDPNFGAEQIQATNAYMHGDGAHQLKLTPAVPATIVP